MVGATSDGASVNTGVYNGLLTRFKNERAWLVTIHCVSHRLELSLKDSLTSEKSFVEVKTFMNDLYYAFKKSGKFKRTLKKFGIINDVTVYTHPKVHGTRFLAHQLRGVNALINNWVPLGLTIENMCATQNNAKLLGFLRKLRNYDFLGTACLYKAFLETLTPMSLKFQEGKLFLFDIECLLSTTKSHVTDLKDDNYDEVDAVESYTQALLSVNGTEIVANLLKRGHANRKPENQEYKQLTMNGMTHTGDQTKVRLTRLRDRAVLKVVECLDSRLGVRLDSHTNDDKEVVQHMKWADPANWVENINTEVDSLMSLAEHFRATLEFNKEIPFEFSRKRIKSEWRDLKLAVKHYYNGWKATEMWEQILKFRKHNFPNIVKLVQIVFALGPSNAFVEAGFSQLNGMLNDKRLNLKHKTMENLFLIKANATQFNEEEILDLALEKYMSKKRKLVLEGEVKKKQKLSSDESSSDETETESSVDESSDEYESENEQDGDVEMSEVYSEHEQEQNSDVEMIQSENEVEQVGSDYERQSEQDEQDSTDEQDSADEHSEQDSAGEESSEQVSADEQDSADESQSEQDPISDDQNQSEQDKSEQDNSTSEE